MRRNASFAPDLDKPRATADRVKVTQCFDPLGFDPLGSDPLGFDPLGFDPLGWFAHIPIPKPHGNTIGALADVIVRSQATAARTAGFAGVNDLRNRRIVRSPKPTPRNSAVPVAFSGCNH
jgi:hypothetical protein